MRPSNLLMQDKLPQELLNERAALDWELQLHFSSIVSCGEIRVKPLSSVFSLISDNSSSNSSPFNSISASFFLCSSANSSNSKRLCCSFSPNDTFACLSSSSCCFFQIIKSRFSSESVFDGAAV